MTNTLVDFRASSLPKAEFGKFYTHFLKDFDDSQISLNDEVSVPLLTKARKVLTTYSKSQERVDLTQSTAELVKVDDERDMNIRALLSSTHVLETSPDEAEHIAIYARRSSNLAYAQRRWLSPCSNLLFLTLTRHSSS